ncbi:MAG TPA: hypothetical protein VJJ98_00100 [Sedimentisphaerales bacterium]|nr:hypothetical protein [Sedimentisphaerales bacterium]
MARVKPKLLQNIFEARYDRGYRYLDRCGDAMVILEEALPKISDEHVWMPEEMQPKGARMKCPELDLVLAFDTYRLCLDQNPAEKECPFEEIAKYTFDTVVAKFDIRETRRFGNRQVYLFATDSIEEAERLSLKRVPLSGWPTGGGNGLEARSREATIVMENDDKSVGVRFAVKPAFKTEAPLEIDARLKMAPHLLKEGQREALLAQLKRQKQRQESPLAGLVLDMDYCWTNPEKPDVSMFLSHSTERIRALLKAFTEDGK